MACVLFGAVAPNDPDVLKILAAWSKSCYADGKFPRANHGWRMITLYCCDSPSDPLPSLVAVDKADKVQAPVELQLELTDKAILALYTGERLKLKKGRGVIMIADNSPQECCHPCKG